MIWVALYLVAALCAAMGYIYLAGQEDSSGYGLTEERAYLAILVGALWPVFGLLHAAYFILSPLAKAAYAAGVRANERKRDASHSRD